MAQGFKMYTKYKSFLSQYITLNSIEWNILKLKLKVEKNKKGKIIHSMGNVCTKLAFINSGLARAYMISEDGKDYTWSIFFNDENSQMVNLFVVDYDSFINRKESNLYIEALEDCELITLEYSDIEFLYKKFKSGERFGRLMSQEAYSYLHNMAIDKQLKSSKERFDKFMQTTPYLLDKVPQYHIATFLGITPQHLSRLKNALKSELLT